MSNLVSSERKKKVLGPFPVFVAVLGGIQSLRKDWLREDGFKQVLQCPVKRASWTKELSLNQSPLSARSKKLPIKFEQEAARQDNSSLVCVDSLRATRRRKTDVMTQIWLIRVLS